MTPFYTRFPELAARETRTAHVLSPGGPVPVGEYGFVECYCDTPGCDCRRVLVEVVQPHAPRTPLAVITFGWESEAFYAARNPGDTGLARMTIEASLDPLHPQSQHADALLEIFQQTVRDDPAYVARLARHYEMFKAAPGFQPRALAADHPTAPKPASPSVAEILRQLQFLPERTPFAPYEAALRAALAQSEAIVPELIAAVDRVSANPEPYLKTGEENLHLFALCLLAELRERRALDSFLRFFALPGEQALDLTGDMVTEHGAAMLASVCGGDPAPLRKLVLDEAVNEFVRTQAIDALVVQAAWGERSREAVVEDLRQLFRTLPRPGNALVWAGVTGAVCDLHAPELAAEARAAFAQGIVDDTVLDQAWLEKQLFERGAQCCEDFRQRNPPIDAVACCSAWQCFREETEPPRFPWAGGSSWPSGPGALPEPPAPLPPPKPFVAPPKVGRNEPCPCGSGKKFKKCCGSV